MRMVVVVIGMLLLTAAGSPAAAADSTDAKTVLNRAAAALADIESVRYEATAKVERGGRWGRPEQITVTGTLLLAPSDHEELPRVHADCSIRAARTPRPMKFTIVFDGEKVIAIDPTQRTYQQVDWPEGRMLTGNILPLLIPDYVSKTPLKQAQDTEGLEHTGTETVNAVACDVIRVPPGDSGSEATWYFGREDHLPRRVVRKMGRGPQQMTFTTDIANMVVQPTPDADAFAVKPPKGFAHVTPGGQLAPGQPAPEWTLKDAEGNSVSLKNLRGNLVVLDFWATWCGPCKRMMPAMQKMHEKYAGKPVKIFGVNCMERGDPVKFMKQHDYTYPLLLKGDRVKQQYRVRGIPTFYLIGPEGEILMAFAGASPEQKKAMEKLIDETLTELSSSAQAGAEE